jgi:hypothetical protein
MFYSVLSVCSVVNVGLSQNSFNVTLTHDSAAQKARPTRT